MSSVTGTTTTTTTTMRPSLRPSLRLDVLSAARVARKRLNAARDCAPVECDDHRPPSSPSPQLVIQTPPTVLLGDKTLTSDVTDHHRNHSFHSHHHHHHHHSHHPYGSVTPSLPTLTPPPIGGPAGEQQRSFPLQRQQQPLVASVFGDKYVILDQLEASSLYKCIDKDTLHDYICKVIPSKNYQDYLVRHLRLAGHRGINQVERVVVGPKNAYILFSSSHGDLHSYVRTKRRLKECEAANLFHQIVSVVADCHSNGIVLRDIKLRKFVFKDHERTQLNLETLDDAIVLKDADDDGLSDKHGCPAYVSPEILSHYSSQYSGKAADCWSLGVILFTMLVGRYPFHDNDPSALFGKIRRGAFSMPDTLSPVAKILIKSLLRRDPAERMTADEVLSSKWFKLMSSPSSMYYQHHETSIGNMEYGGSSGHSQSSLTPSTAPASYADFVGFTVDGKSSADQIVPIFDKEPTEDQCPL